MTEEQKAEAKEIVKLYRKLVRAECHPFPKPYGKLDAPTERGVYVIENMKGTPLHVGQTRSAKNGIRQRLYNHLTGSSAFRKSYFNNDRGKIRKDCQFKYLVVPNPRNRSLLEAYAAGHLCPKHIGSGKD